MNTVALELSAEKQIDPSVLTCSASRNGGVDRRGWWSTPLSPATQEARHGDPGARANKARSCLDIKSKEEVGDVAQW